MPPYSDQQSALVQRTIDDGLVRGARYSVVVSVNTSGGMSTSSQLSFVGKYNESHDSLLVICDECERGARYSVVVHVNAQGGIFRWNGVHHYSATLLEWLSNCTT